MTYEHLPGCDRRHSRRRQCGVPSAAKEESPVAASIWSPTTQAATRPGVRRTRRLVIGLALIVAASAVLIVGLVAGIIESDRLGPGQSDQVSFPEWARPTGAIELTNERQCPADGPWLPPCRTLRFGTQRAYEDVVRELKTVLESRSWGANFEMHDMSLHAVNKDDIVCMLFYNGDDLPPRTPEGPDLTKRASFPVTITVVVDRCWAAYGS